MRRILSNNIYFILFQILMLNSTSPWQTPGKGPVLSSLPVSRLELSVACTNLADTDVLSKSDPVCVMLVKNSDKWMEYGRTERIDNSLSPNWMKKFTIDYKFEERQILKFMIYDLDSSSSQLSHHDFLGEIEVMLIIVVCILKILFR